jgi:hypothetical protein
LQKHQQEINSDIYENLSHKISGIKINDLDVPPSEEGIVNIPLMKGDKGDKGD